jgi:hypothetical protein
MKNSMPDNFYSRCVIGQSKITRYLCWSQLENGERERERIGWKSPDRVGPDALEPARKKVAPRGAVRGGILVAGVDGQTDGRFSS